MKTSLFIHWRSTVGDDIDQTVMNWTVWMPTQDGFASVESC